MHAQTHLTFKFNWGALFLKGSILEARQSKYDLSFTFSLSSILNIWASFTFTSQWLCGNCRKAFHFRQPSGRKNILQVNKLCSIELGNRKCPRKGKGKGKRRILNNKSKTVEFFFFPFHVVFFGKQHCFGLSEDLEQHCEQHCFERRIFSRFIFSLIPRGMWIENWPLLQLISRKISPPCKTLSISSFDIFQNNLQDVPLN